MTFPDLDPSIPHPPIELDQNGLYYLSSFDSIAPCMEVSTLAAKNIVALIAKKF